MLEDTPEYHSADSYQPQMSSGGTVGFKGSLCVWEGLGDLKTY